MKGLRAVVAGAGSIGLLCAYLAVELGFEVEVLDVKNADSPRRATHRQDAGRGT